MNSLQFFFDWVRTFTGRRRLRVLPRRCAKPSIGTRIVLMDAGLRLTLPAGLSDAIWLWLLDGGWRVERYRPDRRQYRDISRSQVEHLLTCDPALRARLLDQGDHVAQPLNFGFPVSPRTLPGVHGGQSPERLRFLKPNELQVDRYAGAQRRGS
jgi:hypothetical protein